MHNVWYSYIILLFSDHNSSFYFDVCGNMSLCEQFGATLIAYLCTTLVMCFWLLIFFKTDIQTDVLYHI